MIAQKFKNDKIKIQKTIRKKYKIAGKFLKK